jgi:cation diffusion facilitator CzcD-associated flavoprotein CzcO
VTQTPRLAGPCRRIAIIGAGAAGQSARAALLAAGVRDIVTLDKAGGRELRSARFDDDTDTWLLTTARDEIFQARVVIAAHRPVEVPWLPDIAGRNDFRGVSFHAARWQPDFDPTGKRVAVIGTDATAGHHIPRLVDSAASVTVFAHPPRRIVPELPLPTTRAKRWLRRHIRPAAHDGPAPTLVGSAIGTITPSGIRTIDGVDHDVDAIVYGTGFAIPDRISDKTLVGVGGMSIRQIWADGMEPYFGVALRGLPNYFFVSGPDVDAKAGYIAKCVGRMERTASTRIEVRRSSQQVFNERSYVSAAQPHRVVSAFDLSSSARGDDETYDGAATLTIAGIEHPVRVRLAGHLDPIDGRYHWQGTVFGSSSGPLPDEALKQARTATLTVGAHSASGRVIERTPWGTHTVAGVGAPPYALR